MPEQDDSHEAINPFEKRIALRHGQGIAIDMSNTIQDDTLAGGVVAILEFPGTPDVPSKKVAIVDYGPEYHKEAIVPGAPGLGKPQSRYGLRTLNYMPDSHMLTYAPLPPDQQFILGRREEASNTNYMLGLGQQDSGNEAISQQHVSVIHNNRTLHVTDISRNGTIVEHQA